MSKPPFFFVWKEGSSEFTARHPTETQAEFNARNLAVKFPGEIFYVLKPVIRIEKREISTTKYEADL